MIIKTFYEFGSMVILWISLMCLIVISGFFSAAEIGMMSINRYKLHHWVKKKHKQALRVYQLLNHPDRLLSVILIGTTLSNIMASMLATLIGQRLYGDWGGVLATLLLTLIILIFSEIAPKTWAALYPQWTAFATALPLKMLQTVLLPLVSIVSFLGRGLLRIFGVQLTSSSQETLTQDELRSVVYEASGMLPNEHKGMMMSLWDLGTSRVEDIMIPTSEIWGIDLDQPWSSVLENLEALPYTRVPLYRGQLNGLVGVLHSRDLLALILEKTLTLASLLAIVKPPYFVPEGTLLNQQIVHFQQKKCRSGFVVDEFGALKGLITLDDILEEVVGEFTTDMIAFTQDIVFESERCFIVDASMTLRDLQRRLNWTFPALGPRTLSGLIIEYLGYIPPAHSCLRLNEYRIEILKVVDHTIRSVRIELIA